MIEPIRAAQGLFPPSDVPCYGHPALPGCEGPFEIAEPRLLATDVPWRPNSRGAITNLLPATSPLPASPTQLTARALGGKLTVCVLCYGNYFETQRQCLDSILRTVPAGQLDLRVACNAVGPATLDYVRQLPGLTKLYTNHHNRFKYPAMRQLLHDPEHPLTTSYVAWFDDNTRVVNPRWLALLNDEIARQRSDVGAYGPLMYYSLRLHRTRDPRKWFAGAGWYRGLPLRTQRGTPAPNGDTIHFVADWFLVLRTDAIRLADIPDPRLRQRGGDIVIGEQLYQNGWQLKQFNSGKNLVFTPAYNQGLKRGKPESFPWQ